MYPRKPVYDVSSLNRIAENNYFNFFFPLIKNIFIKYNMPMLQSDPDERLFSKSFNDMFESS